MVKNLPDTGRDVRDSGLIPGSGRSLRGGRQSAPVFLPGDSPRIEEPAGLSPWGSQESDTSEAT